jgi:hypothetical protein
MNHHPAAMTSAVTSLLLPATDTEDTAEDAACASCRSPIDAGDDLCDDCRRCDRCDDPAAADDGAVTFSGSWICDACLDDYYWRCQGCDEYIRDGDDCGNGCDDEDDALGDLLYSYEYKPEPVFHGTGPLFLGPEIEIEAMPGDRRACAEIALHQLGNLGYLKEDESLDDGFEIVTHPMSYAYALAWFPWRMLADLHRAGAVASSSCGLHVHVSRAGFDGPCHAYRWMKFVYRNQPHVIRLARRDSPGYAAFSDEARRSVKDCVKGSRGDNRNVAINTNNDATYELRIFASSLDPGEVKAAFAFAHASIEYTRSLTAADILHRDGWTWPAFTDWVAQRPVYQPLSDKLAAQSCAC